MERCPECHSSKVVLVEDEDTGEQLWRCREDACFTAWENECQSKEEIGDDS